MKWIRRLLLVLFVVVVAVVAAVVIFGGDLIQKGVETVGPKVTGVPVTLDQAFLYPVRGKAGLKGLTVNNPEGFNTDHLMKLDGISVDIDMASLKTDTVVIKSIVIDKPDICYEMSLKGSNLKALLDGMEKEGGEEGPEDAEADSDAPGKKVVIESLKVVDGVVRISTKLMQGLNAPIPLPDIEMTDIGKEEGGEGASLPDVIAMVLKEIAGSVTSVATGAINIAGKGVKAVGAGAVEGAKLAGDGVAAVGSGAVEGAKMAGEGAKAVGEGAVTSVKAVGKGAGSLVKGVGGLFGAGDEKDEAAPAE